MHVSSVSVNSRYPCERAEENGRLFSAQALAGFFHGLALTGEELPNEEIRDLPESIYGTVFDLFVAANNTIFNFLKVPTTLSSTAW